MLDRYDQDLLLDYLEGELDADRRAQLDAMLADDPQLAGLLSEMALDRAALRSLPEAQAPADLVHDVTQTLERRMLLDEPIDETGPIPLSRGRGLPTEPARSISWGRVVGLTGLAASVALAAGIVVITLDDPLERAANSLAATPTHESIDASDETALATDDVPAATIAEGISAEIERDAEELARTGEGLSSDLLAGTTHGPKPGIDPNAIALGPEPPAPRDPLKPTVAAPELNLPGESEADQPLANFAFGSTAAISVIQPRQQLVLLTESPEVSLEQLFEFCVANGIPIVQPDEQAHLDQLEDQPSTKWPQAENSPQPLADANESIGDYALLISDSQLDSLVQSLNTGVTLEPSRAGKASLISNQAAMLAELPEETSYRYGALQARQARVVEENKANDQPDSDSFAYDERIEQQAVQLRLPPDLGSDYANSRNAYNLKLTKERATYAADLKTQPTETADHLEEALADGDAGADTDQSNAVEKVARPNSIVPPAEGLAEEKAPDKEPSTNTTPADRAADDPATQGSGNTTKTSIDPARGNWLRAHLPSTDTTPLLLQWRTEQSAKPTSLVPVTIKRAEPDKVNTLRMRQQVELAGRVTTQPDKAKAEEGEQPAEAEPAEETAPSTEPGE